MAFPLHVCTQVSPPPSYKDVCSIRLGPHAYNFTLTFIILLKALLPDIVTLGINASTYEFGRHTIQSITLPEAGSTKKIFIIELQKITEKTLMLGKAEGQKQRGSRG